MTRSRGQVLVAVFGSAGDLFPLVPLIRMLRSEGHDVRCAVPRALGLYLRAWRIPMYALGSGAEMRVFDDEHIITNRFGGWASWRRTVTDYVLPTLRNDVEVLGRIFRQWRPDVVVCGSFSPAARIAAHVHGVPRVEVSIYPQQRHRLCRARSFAYALRQTVAQLCDIPGGPREDLVSDLAWGTGGRGVVLHDRALLGGLHGIEEVVGFPYWDEGPQRPGDEELVDGWLDRSQGPIVMVTLGSFIGARQRQTWLDAADAVEALGVRALFVGPRGHQDDAALQSRGPDLLTVGFVPLSRLADRIDAVVHHGGVGTMFGTLRAGRPAVVVPQAFDQSFNAELVDRVGAGLDATARSLHDALAQVLDQPRFATAGQRLAGELVPVETATERVVERVMEWLG